MKCIKCDSENINVWESGDYLTSVHIEEAVIYGAIIDVGEKDLYNTSHNSSNAGFTCNDCGHSWDR
jgi:hypothetical protein